MMTNAEAMERCEEIIKIDSRGFASGVCIAHTFTLKAIINQLESHLVMHDGRNAKNEQNVGLAIALLKQAKEELKKYGQELASDNEHEAFRS